MSELDKILTEMKQARRGEQMAKNIDLKQVSEDEAENIWIEKQLVTESLNRRCSNHGEDWESEHPYLKPNKHTQVASTDRVMEKSKTDQILEHLKEADQTRFLFERERLGYEKLNSN